MEETAVYTKRDVPRATSLAAFLGWLAVCIPPFLLDPVRMLMLLPWAAAIGLPIAYGSCWLIGAPVLRRVMRRPVSWLGAAVWGAGIAAAMAAVSIAFGRYLGWRQSLNPNFNSKLGGGEFVRSVDGIFTPYGWWVVAQNTAEFMPLGACIALIIRWRIGPGRRH